MTVLPTLILDTVDPKFDLGQLVMTAGVGHWLATNYAGIAQYIGECLIRHLSGDWGNVADPSENDHDLANGGRLLSQYAIPDHITWPSRDTRVWVVTEWDRSVTTILFPSEY